MLTVDLARLNQAGSDRIDAELGIQDPVWADVGAQPGRALSIRLEAVKAGRDAVVRGRIAGEVLGTCRRCQAETRSPIDESLLLVFRAGMSPVEAEAAEIYPLPSGVRELDLTPAIREHLILAVPRYTLCREDCRGRCPGCGAELNVDECRCPPAGGDDRWAALRRLAQ